MSEVIRVAELLWKEVNPESKMSEPPSMVYEIVEKRWSKYGTLREILREQTSFEDFARMISKETFTKEEAMLMISWGYHMTHAMFTNNEFFTRSQKSAAHFIDEYGNIIDKLRFWKYRATKAWDTDWTVHKVEKLKT